VTSGSGDHDAIHRALNGIAPSNGPADLSAALSLAAGIVRAGEDSRAYIFSDGIVEPLRTSFANGVPFPIEYHRVGVSGENVGLTSLTVRTSAQSRAAYLRVHNFGQQARTVTLEWRSDAGLIDLRSVSLSGGQAQDLALPVPDAANTVTARIDAKDNFGLDDTGTAIARTPRPFRVLLVTPGKRAFTVDGMRRVIEDYGQQAYDRTTYYEKWIRAVRNLVVEQELLTREEVEARMAEVRARYKKTGRKVSKENVPW